MLSAVPFISLISGPLEREYPSEYRFLSAVQVTVEFPDFPVASRSDKTDDCRLDNFFTCITSDIIMQHKRIISINDFSNLCAGGIQPDLKVLALYQA
jgi:hypothetical protein